MSCRRSFLTQALQGWVDKGGSRERERALREGEWPHDRCSVGSKQVSEGACEIYGTSPGLRVGISFPGPWHLQVRHLEFQRRAQIRED